MYEVDFLPIERTGEGGSKSGDAITIRFREDASGLARVVVIDGGFSYTGEAVIEHVQRWYDTSHVDLMISTHPDQDHLNGLTTVMDELAVGELMIHIPQDHAPDADDFSNIEVVDALIGLAEEKGVRISEPFTGAQRFDGHITILGPSQAYYETLLAEHLLEVQSGAAAARFSTSTTRPGLMTKAADLLSRVLAYLPIETLGEDGDCGPRNNSSVVTLLQVDGERMLLTGDAGIPALNQAWDEYEAIIGRHQGMPLHFFQAPHHGSRRNLSPSLLNRIFGDPGSNPGSTTSFISSAKQDAKHPSPKVTNALRRRGVESYATEGNSLLHKSSDLPMRPGYGPVTAIGPLEEGDD